MKPDIKLPTKEEKIEHFKKFGKKYVFPERLEQWNKMVEDTIGLNKDDVLKIAACTMRDLEEYVSYDALEYSLEFPCSDSPKKKSFLPTSLASPTARSSTLRKRSACPWATALRL